MNKKTLARRTAALIACAGLGLATPALAQDKTVKIGVLNDMSSLYADATGKGSLAATEMAVADYGGKVKGKPVVVISADHQNKPDVGFGIARNWYDNAKVDAAALVARGLIRGTGKPVKVLADGEAPKGLKLAIHKVSSAARAKIEAMGGSVETVE